MNKFINQADGIINLLFPDSGKCAKEERAVHHRVRGAEVAAHPAGNVLICRLFKKITSEEVPGFNFVCVEKIGQFGPRKSGAYADGDWISEPRRVSAVGRLRENENIFPLLEPFCP